MYKEDPPLGPVVSMIRATEYNLDKYLVRIINDAMPSTYMLNSTGSVVNQINSFHFRPCHVSISYVYSFFIHKYSFE